MHKVPFLIQNIMFLEASVKKKTHAGEMGTIPLWTPYSGQVLDDQAEFQCAKYYTR